MGMIAQIKLRKQQNLTLKVSPGGWQVSPQSPPVYSRPVPGNPAMGRGSIKCDEKRHRFGAKVGTVEVDIGR